VTDDALLESLKQAAMPPPPRDFRPGVKFAGRTPSEITTGPMPAMEASEYDDAVRAAGFPLPETHTLVLDTMEFVERNTSAAWHRDEEDKGKEHTAYTKPTNGTMWRYRFKVVPKSARHDEDIAVLMAEAKAVVHDLPLNESRGLTTKVIDLADFQIGKTDELGGTKETLKRSEAALATVVADLVASPVDQIVLVDGGDSTEGFESSPTANRTNDLQQTEQIRVWRRILWRWIEALAPLTTDLVVIGVPSNHCRVRAGKNALGHALDDWGIEVISQVQDIAAVNPDAFGHVRFMVPNDHEEHVLFTLAGGQVLGVIHGHQVTNPDRLPAFIKQTGRRGLSVADVVLVHHFHHSRRIAFGDNQWMHIAPTNDPGSSWFTPQSGERSEPGILTLTFDAVRHTDEVIWLGNIA
jgi:hypothetical protein